MFAGRAPQSGIALITGGTAVIGFGVTIIVHGHGLSGAAVIAYGVAVIMYGVAAFGPSAIEIRVRKVVDRWTKVPETGKEIAESQTGKQMEVGTADDLQTIENTLHWPIALWQHENSSQAKRMLPRFIKRLLGTGETERDADDSQRVDPQLRAMRKTSRDAEDVDEYYS